MNRLIDQKEEQEVRQRIIELLRLVARDVVKRLREDQGLDSSRQSDRKQTRKQ